MKPSDLAVKAAEAEQTLQTYLTRMHTGRPALPGRARQERDPERLKVISRLAARLRDMQRLVHRASAASEVGPRPDDDDPGLDIIAARVKQISGDPASLHAMDLDAAWDLSDALKQDLLYVGDDHYLLTRLEAEQGRGEDADSWSSHNPGTRLKHVIAALRSKEGKAKGLKRRDAREIAIRRLCFLYDQRAASGRAQRMAAQVRSTNLRWLSTILFILLVLLGWVALRITPRANGVLEFLAVIVAGGLGNTLAGAYKLRDAALQIRDLRGFGAQYLAMPILGATAAGALYFLFASGLVRIGEFDVGGLNWMAMTGLGFLAGFSEPFFLGTVARMVGVKEAGAR